MHELDIGSLVQGCPSAPELSLVMVDADNVPGRRTQRHQVSKQAMAATQFYNGPRRGDMMFNNVQISGDLRDDLSVEWLENLFMSAGISAMALAAKQGIGDEETAANIVSLFLDGARSKRPT